MASETDAAFSKLWSALGGDAAAPDRIAFTGDGPCLPSVFKVGLAAQLSEGAAGLAAAEIWRDRSGAAQTVAVDREEAAIGFRSERHVHVVGVEPEYIWDDVSGHYRCGDGRWVQLHCNYIHHLAGTTAAFRAPVSRPGLQAALDRMSGEQAEQVLIESGMPGGMMRTTEEWRAHPAGKALDGIETAVPSRVYRCWIARAQCVVLAESHDPIRRVEPQCGAEGGLVRSYQEGARDRGVEAGIFHRSPNNPDWGGSGHRRSVPR